MVRQELHNPRRPAAALSPRPRPQFDAVAWNAAHEEEERMTQAVAALLEKLEAAATMPAASETADKAA